MICSSDCFWTLTLTGLYSGQGLAFLDVALIEEISEEDCIGSVHAHSQVEQIITKHAAMTRASHVPRKKIHIDSNEHLRQLQDRDRLRERERVERKRVDRKMWR